MKASEFRRNMVLALATSVMPAIAFHNWWLLVFAALIVAVSVTARVHRVREITRKNQELE